MLGGGPFDFDPGEYSDDTAMAVCIAEVSSTGVDLASDDALDQIAERFLDWAPDANDVGAQTRRVFGQTQLRVGRVGWAMLDASKAYALDNPGRVGNGALMRTAIVGISRLDDRDATSAAARAVAALTHADPLGLDLAVLWSEAVRLAVLERSLELRSGLDLIPAARRDLWAVAIADATNVDPRTFVPNGFVIWALQAAWAAITWTPIQPDGSPGSTHLAEATKNAVRAGDDTDTIAAIAGGLLGARWGVAGVPST